MTRTFTIRRMGAMALLAAAVNAVAGIMIRGAEQAAR